MQAAQAQAGRRAGRQVDTQLLVRSFSWCSSAQRVRMLAYANPCRVRRVLHQLGDDGQQGPREGGWCRRAWDPALGAPYGLRGVTLMQQWGWVQLTPRPASCALTPLTAPTHTTPPGSSPKSPSTCQTTQGCYAPSPGC